MACGCRRSGEEWTNDRTTRAAGGGSLRLTRREASITLQQRIFDGFEANSTIDREQARVESAANRVHENAEFLALDVIGSYVEVLRQRELVRLSEVNLRVHIGILDSLQDLLDIAFVYSADVSNVVGEEYETTVRLGEQSVADLLLALMDIHQGEFCFVIRDYGVLMIDREVAERIDGATIPPNVPLIRE